MAGYRSAFINTATLLSGLLPMKPLIGLSGQRLLLPVYHLISNQAPIHIKHLYRVKGESEFIKDLDFILKYYQPIDLPALQDIVRNGKQVPNNVFMMTFDDGLSEFHDVVAPILLKKGVPAINFLNSDFIGNKDLFFRYKASLLIDTLKKNNYEKLNDPLIIEWIITHMEKDVKSLVNHYGGLCKMMLSVGYEDRGLLDELAKLSGVDFKSYLAEKKPYMTIEQVSTLLKQGFYFGSHSCSHPEYRFIDLATQLRETRESLEHIADTFQLAYRTFAFPFTDFGVKRTFFDQLGEAPGIDITFGSAGLKNDPVSFHLQRVPMEMGSYSGAEVLKSEYVYYLVKQLFGKNTIHRA